MDACTHAHADAAITGRSSDHVDAPAIPSGSRVQVLDTPSVSGYTWRVCGRLSMKKEGCSVLVTGSHS